MSTYIHTKELPRCFCGEIASAPVHDSKYGSHTFASPRIGESKATELPQADDDPLYQFGHTQECFANLDHNNGRCSCPVREFPKNPEPQTRNPEPTARVYRPLLRCDYTKLIDVIADKSGFEKEENLADALLDARQSRRHEVADGNGPTAPRFVTSQCLLTAGHETGLVHVFAGDSDLLPQVVKSKVYRDEAEFKTALAEAWMHAQQVQVENLRRTEVNKYLEEKEKSSVKQWPDGPAVHYLAMLPPPKMDPDLLLQWDDYYAAHSVWYFGLPVLPDVPASESESGSIGLADHGQVDNERNARPFTPLKFRCCKNFPESVFYNRFNEIFQCHSCGMHYMVAGQRGKVTLRNSTPAEAEQMATAIADSEPIPFELTNEQDKPILPALNRWDCDFIGCKNRCSGVGYATVLRALGWQIEIHDWASGVRSPTIRCPWHPLKELAKQQRVYMAGPMTGIVDHNFPAFEAAEEALRSDGYEVVSPRELSISDESYGENLKRDIHELLTCDKIYMLRGWYGSPGASCEHTLARLVGMKVFYEIPEALASDI